MVYRLHLFIDGAALSNAVRVVWRDIGHPLTSANTAPLVVSGVTSVPNLDRPSDEAHTLGVY